MLTVLISCIFPLLACRRAPSPSSQTSQKPVEQRATELEQSLNDGSNRPTGTEPQKEAERDLAEIRSMGLEDRALREFGSRFPSATIDSCRISYFMDTNRVWCSIGYRVPGKDDLQDDSFGYIRQSGTNWVLMK